MDNIDLVAAQKLFTIKKNQLKLVRRRGYILEENEENLLYITLEDFLEAYLPFAESKKKSLRNILSRLYYNDRDEKIYVYYADNPKTSKQLGIDAVTDAIANLDKNRSKNLLLITPVPLTSAASKKIQELVSYNIHIFLESEMVYDPTEHYFTPEHKALTKEEQRQFLETNGFNIDQISIMLTSDMIARYYGFRVGQIIKIRRQNTFETLVQESLSYRVVKQDF